MRHPLIDSFPDSRINILVNSQNGSTIFIVLLLLVIMSLIGVVSTNNSVTENFIVRNTTMRKQNVMMADAVAAEALQQLLDAGITDSDLDDPPLPTEAEISPKQAPLDWVHDDDDMATDAGFTWADWYSRTTGRLLHGDPNANSELSHSITINNGTGVSEVLVQRGELNTTPPRYALAGWAPVTGGSLKMTSATRRAGRVLVEYMSEDYGVIRLTVGIERWFM